MLATATAQISQTSWNKEVYEPSDVRVAEIPRIKDIKTEEGDLRFRPLAYENLHQSLSVLEIGCGSGFVICSMALMLKQLKVGAHLFATDHSLQAVTAASATLRNHGIFNPPYVPTPDEEVARGGITSAWAGGSRGRKIIDRVLCQIDELLAPGGELYMVTVAENDPQGIIMDMQGKGYQGEIVACRQADEETLSIICLRKPEAASCKDCLARAV